MEQPTIARMPQISLRAPTRTGLPSVLVDLITIYDDDEGSVTSHIALIPITYEEVPGEMADPDVEGLLQDSETRDIDIENVDVSVTFPQQ
jgi:hypothetical protein